MGQIVDEFFDKGEKFWRCKHCKRVGKYGWAHICNGSNWYKSVAELRAALATSNIPPGTIVRGTKP